MRHLKHPDGPPHVPLIGKILMAVGALTLTYLFIKYVIIPILAYFTVQ